MSYFGVTRPPELYNGLCIIVYAFSPRIYYNKNCQNLQEKYGVVQKVIF